MCGASDKLPTPRTMCRGLQMLLLLLLVLAVPAAAAPVTSTDVPAASIEATTLATEDQLLNSLSEKERVALLAYELAAALQRLAEQAAETGDVTEEATARIVTRQGDASDYSDSQSQEEQQQQQPATTPLHRALALRSYSAGAAAAKSISLSETFQSILNRWVQARSNSTYYKVVNVKAKITICFPYNVCFEIQDPWGLCCPF